MDKLVRITIEKAKPADYHVLEKQLKKIVADSDSSLVARNPLHTRAYIYFLTHITGIMSTSREETLWAINSQLGHVDCSPEETMNVIRAAVECIRSLSPAIPPPAQRYLY